MSPPEVLLPRLFGEDAARAIMARNHLAPVLDQLRNDGAGLHRRCILVSRLPLLAETADVCAAFSRFGAIEAVALCDQAVVVFRSAASAAAALRAPLPEGPFGPYCEAVPPLDLRPEISYLIPSFIKVALNPPMPMPPPPPPGPGASGCPSSGLGTTHRSLLPEPEWDSPTPFLIEWSSLGTDARKHAREYERARDREYLGEPPEPEPPRVTTTRFVQSDESLLRGPRRGDDGHMRIYGFKITKWRTATAMGSTWEYASKRVDEVASIPAGRPN